MAAEDKYTPEEPITMEEREEDVTTLKNRVETLEAENQKLHAGQQVMEEQLKTLEANFMAELAGLKQSMTLVVKQQDMMDPNERNPTYYHDDVLKFWKCDTYNDCYNQLYDLFTGDQYDDETGFSKKRVEELWLATNPRNKRQYEVSLKRMVEHGFLEVSGKRGSLLYKMEELQSKEDLFEAIGQDAGASGCALLN